MKNITITIIALLTAFQTFAQTGAVEVYAKSNCSQSNNHKLVIDIFIQAEDAAEDIFMAEQNYRFDYNERALANPTLLTTGSDLKFGSPIFSGANVILYAEAAFFLNDNDVSLSTDLRSDSGINLSNTIPFYIASVQFDVLDASLPINFNWHDATEFPPTFLSSNNGGFPVEVPAIFFDNLQATVQENLDCSDSAGCTKVVPELSDLHIECGDDDGATIVIEAGNPNNVILEGKTLSYWINHPNFSDRFYYNELNGYYYFEKLPAFISNVEDGNCGTSLTTEITKEVCKLGNNPTINQIKIYPNPANRQITIDLNSQEFKTGTVAIFDLAGKEVQVKTLSVNQSDTRLNTSDLANGIYLIKINTDGKEIHTEKLTIAH